MLLATGSSRLFIARRRLPEAIPVAEGYYAFSFSFIFISFIENGIDFYTWGQLQFCY